MKILIELFDHRYELWNYPEWCLGEIRALAYDHEVIAVASEDQAMRHITDAEVYFGWRVSEDKLKPANNLKWIHSASDDIRKQLYPAFVESDIRLTMSRGTRASAVAEHALGMMLYFARQFHICVRSQMRAAWARGTTWDHFPEFKELEGSVVGIIGLGRIGRELARRCKALNMEVIATTKRWPSEKPDYVDHLGPPEDMPLLLEESDFLVCCIPETGDTETIMGYTEFKRMKKNSYFFNVGRGTAVNEDELVEALMDHLLAGAGMDAFEREPLPDDSYLWRLEGTLITPRIAGIGPHFWKRTHETFLDLLRKYLDREPFDEEVEKRVWIPPAVEGSEEAESEDESDAEPEKKSSDF